VGVVSVTAGRVVGYAKGEADAKIKEGENNDNKYGRWFKMNNVPWCMIFVQWCFSCAKAKDLILRTAGCEAFEAWAVKEKLTVSPVMVQPGDIVLFDFHKENKSVHVEIAVGPIDTKTHLIPTVGGNTCADGAKGSQANGDGVYYKKRKLESIRLVVRPNWKD
jgi:hypothetical protein